MESFRFDKPLLVIKTAVRPVITTGERRKVRKLVLRLHRAAIPSQRRSRHASLAMVRSSLSCATQRLTKSSVVE